VLSVAVTTNHSEHTLIGCLQSIDTWHLCGKISRYQGVNIIVLCGSTINVLQKTLLTTVAVKWMFCTSVSSTCQTFTLALEVILNFTNNDRNNVIAEWLEIMFHIQGT
jgi:hypothetical protein